MCLAWKISPYLGCYVDKESIPLKILFTSVSKLISGTSTNPCFPLRRAYLFNFMLSHHLLIKKHPLESTAVICMHYHQFILDMTASCSTMNYNVQSLLELWWCSAFMFCSLIKGQRDTTIVILYHGCFDNVLPFEISYYCSLADYVIDMSHYNL